MKIEHDVSLAPSEESDSERQQTRTALVVDDSAIMRRNVVEAISGADLFDRIVEVCDGIEALRVLVDEPVTLVICDLEMPRMNGLQLVRAVRARPELVEVPFLLLTSCAASDIKVEALTSGASDYVTKPFVPAELIARVKIHLRMRLLQEKLRRKNAQLESMALTDQLTGLANRRTLLVEAERELNRLLRYGGELGALMLDLDHFKSINDTHGHAAGDTVLSSMGQVLRQTLRKTDIAARYGGEEFFVLLPNTPASGCLDAAERLRAAVRKELAVGPDRERVTVSIGAAHLPTQEGITTPGQLFAAADAALYRAKQNGRDRVEPAWDDLAGDHAAA